MTGLFLTDLDGTLLRTSKRISELDFAALAGLRQRGISTVAATGRSLSSALKVLPPEAPFDYLIASTGAAIYRWPEQDLLFRSELDCHHVQELASYFEAQNINFMLHNRLPDNHKFWYRHQPVAGEPNLDFKKRIDFYAEHAEELPETLPKFATQLLVILPPDLTHKVKDWRKALADRYSVIRATSPFDHRSIWVEIFKKGTSKGSAAAWLKSSLDVSATAAIGNDYNDEDLLVWADHSYVVENSPAHLVEKFEPVSSNDNNAVAQAIGLWTQRLGAVV